MLLRTLLAAVAAALAVLPVSAKDTDVDAELVLAVDVSGSMDEDEQRLQRSGYIDAFRHAAVMSAIAAGALGRIAVTYVEWAGPETQTVIVPWTVIDSPAAGRGFSGMLAAAPMSRFRGTSISGSLAFAAAALDRSGFSSARRLIDISGDGPNNMGIPIRAARKAAVDRGITINGLPIMIKKPNGFYSIDALDIYYEDCVIGGPGAFLVAVQTSDTFVSAIRRKLVLEIAGREPAVVPASETVAAQRIDCMIGEKLREQWMRE